MDVSALLDTVHAFDGKVQRNITSLQRSQDLFADLYDAEDIDAATVFIQTEANVKARSASTDFIERGFLYSTAIGYPFETDHFMASRYSDGRFPVWYGALDLETTVLETLYYMVREVRAMPDWHGELLVRERAVYQVQLTALAFDVRAKARLHPALTADDYHVTWQIGRRLSYEGHPAILYPSARRPGGSNVAVFHRKVLSAPKLIHYLTYRLYPASQHIEVVRPGTGVIMYVDYALGSTFHQIKLDIRQNEPHVDSQGEGLLVTLDNL
jgi:hypothetical protein